MSDDKLLRDLGRLAREQERERAIFELDPPATEALQPISEDEQAEILRRVLPRAPRAGPRTETAYRRRSTLAGAMAVAAAVLAAFIWDFSMESPVPPYQAEVVSALTTGMRGEAAAPSRVIRLEKGMRLEIALRPETEVAGKIAARSFVVAANHQEELRGVAEIDPGGAVRFVFVVGEDFTVPGGRGELVFVVGRERAVSAWRPGGSGGSGGSEDGIVRVLGFEMEVQAER